MKHATHEGRSHRAEGTQQQHCRFRIGSVVRPLPPPASRQVQLGQEQGKGEGDKEEGAVAIRGTPPTHPLPVPLAAGGENAVPVGSTESHVQEVRVVVVELD